MVIGMEIKKTLRGFDLIEFKDQYQKNCSLQMSSLATEDCIWLGSDEDQQTHHVTGEKLSTRMHLTRKQVKELLPYLEHFVKTGDIV